MRSKKNLGLLLGFIVMLAIGYRFSLSNTIEAHQKYTTLKIRRDSLSQVPGMLNDLKKQNTYYDQLLKSSHIETEISFQNNLLKIINSLSTKNNLKVTGFNEPHQFTTDEAVKNTFKFSVKGSYSSILNLIFQLEKNGNLGQIISVNFYKKKDYKYNKVYLECQIYLQRIQQKS